MWRLVAVLTTGWLLFAATPVEGKPPALVELKVGKTAYQGKIEARGKTIAWLTDRDGQLHRVPLGKVDSFREVSSRFRSYPPSDMRTRLLREFGDGYEVQGTRHYLVCAAKGQARKYAEVFENVYRVFHLYFAVRGFKIEEPEFPLVAIVFPNRGKFAEYCRGDGVAHSPGLQGYYMPTTNRVALFASGDEPVVLHGRSDHERGFPFVPANERHAFGETFATGTAIADVRPFLRVQGDLRDTIVHEATHQVAFNTGLHSRIGESPRWVVEGLATVFEAPGIRTSAENRSVESRMNRERYVWFGNFAKSRRPEKSLEAFLRSDGMFDAATLDAYAQAWALTFYLVETRPRDYAKYLKTICNRDPLMRYGEDDRVADFQDAFGENLQLFESGFLRFMSRLK